jgi:molybdopterin adenylyltransferase
MKSAAVVTISDSVVAGTRQDSSGPAVVARLRANGWDVKVTRVVPDERERIAGVLRALSASGDVAAIFTTGGTGLSGRDVTPEATRDVIEREIPGLAVAQRLRLARQCPDRESAWLTQRRRGIAGCYRGSSAARG